MTDSAGPHGDRAVPLIGRNAELATLNSFAESSAADGGALLVVGEPGVGKTALLDAVGGAARNRGSRVLMAAGAEFESDVSYAALNQLLMPVISETESLAPIHSAALSVALGFGDGPVPERLVTATAVLMLLKHVAQESGLVLLVDDLGWVDRASATVLGFIARRLEGSHIRLVAAQRTDALNSSDHAGIRELLVRPLGDEDAGALIAARFPALTPRVRRSIVDESAGNPLALIELSRERTELGVVTQPAISGGHTLNRRLHGLFAARIAALPEATGRLLLLAALDGTGDARIIESSSDAPTMNDLGPAERLDLLALDRTGRRLQFVHPLIRSSVVEMATSGERRSAHRVLAELFEGDDPDASARHLAEATIEPDEDIAARVEQSAYRMLRRGDAVATVTMLMRAADLSPAGVDRGRRLTHAAYVGADVTGGLVNTASLLEQARRADPNIGIALSAAVAAAHLTLNGDGDIDTAHRLLVAALANADVSDEDDQDVEAALHTLMLVCFWGGREQLWEPFDRAMRARQSTRMTLLSVSASIFGDPSRCAGPTLEELDVLVAGLRYETDPAHIVQVGIAASFADRIDECRTALTRVVEDGRQGGAVTSAVYGLNLLATGSLFRGRWAEAEQLSQEALVVCADHGYPTLAWTARWVQAMLAAMRGQRPAVAQDAVTALWAIPRQARAVARFSNHAAQLAALGRGDCEDAFRLVTDICAPGTFPMHEPFALWIFLDLVEAAVRTGRVDAATAHVAAAAEAGIAAISSRMALHCAGAAAMVAADDVAADLFESALAAPASHDWPFDRARVELFYGERLRRTHAMTASRVHLTAANEVFERLGAQPWIDRCQVELRAAGSGRRSSDLENSAALTAQEREIALLAATGLTNRQIGERLYVSSRTVGAHLYRVFPKLGITSRAGLRDALDALASDRTQDEP